MATLQKLRNKGSLLIAFVGIALFAFIAGDIVKLFQKAPEEPTVGTINGKEITVSEFYNLRSECEKYYSAVANKKSLDEGDQEFVTQMTWEQLTKQYVIAEQAKKAGLEVTPEELGNFINSTNWHGWNVQAQNNNATIMPQVLIAQDGTFNAALLNDIIYSLNELGNQDMLTREMAEYINNLNDILVAWKFFQQSLACDIANIKLQQVYALGSASANKAVADNNFNLNKNTYDIEVVAYPMTSFADSLVTVSDDEINAFYNANKDMFKVPTAQYNVFYISQEVKPTSKELQPLDNELKGYEASLRAGDADIKEIEVFSSTEVPYDGFLWTADALDYDFEAQSYFKKFNDSDVKEIEKYNAGEVSAPYMNNDNTYNLVMNVRRVSVPDTIKFRAIAVQSESVEVLNATVDSLLNDLNKKVNFDEVAKNYNADTIEFKTRDFVNYKSFIATPEAQNKLYTAKKNVYDVIEMGENSKLIFQVMDRKGSVEAYDPFIIKRRIPISADTYNKEYGKLSQLLSTSKDLNGLQKNILETNYNMRSASVNANSINIANIPGTRELLRWVLREGDAGKLSDIHEYSIGNKKYLIAVGVAEVTPKGYIALDNVKEQIRMILASEKKGDLIAAEMNGKDFETLKAMKNVITCKPVFDVYYKKATFISETSADEPAISAAVANLNEGAVSAPIKGNNGVYVVKVISKKDRNIEFNADEEANYIFEQSFYNMQNILNTANDIDNRVYEHM